MPGGVVRKLHLFEKASLYQPFGLDDLKLTNWSSHERMKWRKCLFAKGRFVHKVRPNLVNLSRQRPTFPGYGGASDQMNNRAKHQSKWTKRSGDSSVQYA